MAKPKTSAKRVRQNRRRREINKRNRTRLRNQIKKLRRAIEAKDIELARELLNPTLSLIDRSIQKGIIHDNTASRLKSRLTKKVNALTAAEEAPVSK
ncbi:MAG: 30S ribosomal protein S20 [Acidobacteria bacterium]|nr:30S ribosomal protein S20 [Acidobacteriota bacterium]